MNKAALKEIKNMMKESHSNAPYALAAAKKIAKEYDKKINEASLWSWERDLLARNKMKDIDSAMGQWSGEASYYLIYSDGTCAWTSDDDLISGEKLPKLTNIVYASYSGTENAFDTETGELNFYHNTDDYEAEDERKQAYEDAIEIKYGTDYGRKLIQKRA